MVIVTLICYAKNMKEAAPTTSNSTWYAVCGPIIKKAGSIWFCSRKRGHGGPCALTPMKPPLRTRIRNRLGLCRREGHEYYPVQPTLGGNWVRCVNCWYLDEDLPGVHKPRHGHKKWGVTGGGPDA